MAVAISGFRADSAKNLILGPGVVFVNYGETDEFILGMTNGGNSFSPGIAFRDIESDRPFGMVKGLRVIDEINPTITTNLMEMSVANLKVALPGLVEVPFTAEETSVTTGDPNLANYTRLKMGELTDAHYLKNVAVAATVLGASGRPVVCIVRNAIASGEVEISLENKSESTTEITFTGTFLPADVQALASGSAQLEDIVPFEVRYPTITTTA